MDTVTYNRLLEDKDEEQGIKEYVIWRLLWPQSHGLCIFLECVCVCILPFL